jgi:hypothetical protein
MAWEQRRNTSNRYYYRSRRIADGRVVKVYHGTGLRGAQAADGDHQKRAERVRQLQRHRDLLNHIQLIAAPLLELCEACAVITEAAILAAGYHNHRGEWRKKRHGRQFNLCNADW